MSAPERVVTLPPGLQTSAALQFAQAARQAGAQLLEVRNDLWPDQAPLGALAEVMGLLVSMRARPLDPSWLAWAQVVDVPLGEPLPDCKRPLLSVHADAPLTPEEALGMWRKAKVPAGVLVKHVEPLGTPKEAGRLLQTQRALDAEFGSGRVTVLGTGALALPFRCLLSRHNALDYLALEPGFLGAVGQRLLMDAVREAGRKGGKLRFGILGSGISGSRSPRIHRQPFDRLDLPEDAQVGPLLEALTPYYGGFAVTRPFKRQVAAWLGGQQAAVNTLYRRGGEWRGANTDVEGALAVLEALGAPSVTVLGAGGVAPALQQAAADSGRWLRVLRREEASGQQVNGAVVWSWPPGLLPPEGFSLSGAQVAVIAYGAAGRAVADSVRRLDGTPLLLGPRWFIRQARAQRLLWEGNAP